jgi:hypothetical protein
MQTPWLAGNISPIHCNQYFEDIQTWEAFAALPSIYLQAL